MAFPGLDVAPSEAVEDHLHVDEAVSQVDSSDLAVVTVNVNHFDANRLPEDFGRDILARLRSECLL